MITTRKKVLVVIVATLLLITSIGPSAIAESVQPLSQTFNPDIIYNLGVATYNSGWINVSPGGSNTARTRTIYHHYASHDYLESKTQNTGNCIAVNAGAYFRCNVSGGNLVGFTHSHATEAFVAINGPLLNKNYHTYSFGGASSPTLTRTQRFYGYW